MVRGISRFLGDALPKVLIAVLASSRAISRRFRLYAERRRKGVLKMPVIPNTAVLQRIATLPLATYQPGETVLAAGTKTGRLLILRKGAVTIEKEGTEIAKVTEPGAVFGELSALLNQPHTADVRALETSEFRVAPAEVLEQDPAILLYVAAIQAQRLNLANEALVALKSEVQLHHIIGKTIGRAVKKMEELLSATGAGLVHAPGI
jgi:CRP/FNR family cyclic AMP-dependent transcriptional regulator